MDFREDDIRSDLYGAQDRRSEGALHTLGDYLAGPLREARTPDRRTTFPSLTGLVSGLLIGLSLSRVVRALARPR